MFVFIFHAFIYFIFQASLSSLRLTKRKSKVKVHGKLITLVCVWNGFGRLSNVIVWLIKKVVSDKEYNIKTVKHRLTYRRKWTTYVTHQYHTQGTVV